MLYCVTLLDEVRTGTYHLITGWPHHSGQDVEQVLPLQELEHRRGDITYEIKPNTNLCIVNTLAESTAHTHTTTHTLS